MSELDFLLGPLALAFIVAAIALTFERKPRRALAMLAIAALLILAAVA